MKKGKNNGLEERQVHAFPEYNDKSLEPTPENVAKFFHGVGLDKHVEEYHEKYQETYQEEIKITMVQNCPHCGATLEVNLDKPIFYCKYCGTAFVVHGAQVNSRC